MIFFKLIINKKNNYTILDLIKINMGCVGEREKIED